MSFEVIFHHGGHFEKGDKWIYTGGSQQEEKIPDADKWSYFEAIGIVIELGYEHGILLWWKNDAGFEGIRWDSDAAANFALKNKCQVYLYVEIVVDTADLESVVACEEKVADNEGEEHVEDANESDGELESDGNEDDAKGVHFDDSEEERVLGFDDGFTHDGAPEVNASIEIYGNKYNLRTRSDKANVNEEQYNEIGSSVPVDDRFNHEIEDEYFSEELDSSDCDSDSDNIGKKRKFPVFKKTELEKKYKFRVRLEFKSLSEFKEAILEHSVLNGREIRFVKNDKVRARAVCKNKCGFVALVSKEGDKHTYRMKKYEGKHTCGRVFNNKNVNSKWLSKLVAERLMSSENVKINEIITEVMRKYATGVTIARAWKAIKMAKELVDGDTARQYTLLWSYSAELQRACEGNTCKINVDRVPPTLQPRFGAFYFSFDGCKKGFLAAWRPFIGVDGCHLKTKYGGQLLIAVGRDPNDQYFPLAFGVVETETKESWRWFLTLLLEDIGQDNRWVFISDQQKGLIPVFEEMFESLEHRLCLRHLYANLKKKFGGGTAIRDLMMGAAKSTYFKGWEEKMNEIKALDVKAWEWLMGVPTKLWCKHAFPYFSKCDVLMNNISEAFNSTILIARDNPILTMCEWIRTYLMSRIATLRRKVRNWPHKIMPKPSKRLDNEIEHSGNWMPVWEGDMRFEVQHTQFVHRFVVDLKKRTCTFNFWELVGIPCRHAIAGMSYLGEKPRDYVSECYTKDMYELCYNFGVSAINGQSKWPRVVCEEMLTPQFKRGPGRPKKLRRREADENPNATVLKRMNTQYRCTKCDKYDHNSRSCKSATLNPAAQARKRKPKKVASVPASSQPNQPTVGGNDTTNGCELPEEAITQESSVNTTPQPPVRPPLVRAASVMTTLVRAAAVRPAPAPVRLALVRPAPVRAASVMAAAVRPPPISPQSPTSLLYPFPSSAVVTQTIRPPAPPVQPFNPPRYTANEEEESRARNMLFQFMPTPGYRPPSSSK